MKTRNEDLQDGSPLLKMEDRANDAFIKIQRELLSQLAGKKIEDWRACKCQLRLLEEKEYSKLEVALIERFESVGFCLGDGVARLTRDLLKLVKISSYNYLAYDILILIIRLAYQTEGRVIK